MRLAATIAIVLSTLVAVSAQSAKPPAPAAAPGPAEAPQAAPATPEAFSYDAAGRRDPFLNLLGTGTEAQTGSRKADGTASMSVGEISVRGVMQSRGALVAMVMGPDNKTYIMHQGDKFLDGTIKTIMPQGLVIMQAVNDPLSPVKQREIRKLLRGLEDAK